MKSKVEKPKRMIHHVPIEAKKYDQKGDDNWIILKDKEIIRTEIVIN